MSKKSLGNFRNDPLNLPDDDPENTEEIQASMFHQEINTLKIEKLANRVTIISIIIPCLIIAILAFAYLDMKEQVVDVDEAKGSQLEQVAKRFDEKLNALDVRIAKAQFDLEEKLPALVTQAQALENQLAKLTSAKVDQKALEAAVARLDKKIQANTGQDKTALDAVERINRELVAAIEKNNAALRTSEKKITQEVALFKSSSKQITDEINLFKEEFDARLLELSAYDQQMGELGGQIAALSKTTGLMDKQFKTLEQDTQRAMARQLDQLKQELEKKIQALESNGAKSVSTPPNAASPAPAPQAGEAIRPLPQLDTGTGSGSISQETLTQ